MRVFNMTPHTVVIDQGMGFKKGFLPSGEVARVSTRAVDDGEVKSIPVVRTTFGEVKGLPEEKEGTIYIVSSMVAQACRDTRHDLVSPDTSPESAVRDSDGRIVAVRRLQRW